MTTVIVPIDFSDISLHTARYAAQLLVGHYGVTILLYHSYTKSTEAEKATKEIEALKVDLMKNYIVKIDILVDMEDDFVSGLEKTVRHRKAELVIMGITGKSAIAKVFFGSNTLKMAETRACPVLIIPENAPFSKLDNVMLASDFKNIHSTTPSAPIKDFLSVFNSKLHIVNVDKDHYISLTEEYETEKQELKKMFEEFKPEFYFMRLFDFEEAINLFAEERGIDMIIAIQKNHSFIEKILQGSHTKSLTYHSKIPILVMHE